MRGTAAAHCLRLTFVGKFADRFRRSFRALSLRLCVLICGGNRGRFGKIRKKLGGGGEKETKPKKLQLKLSMKR